ncbi:Uncharacterised protein [Achromobacter aegrifaciens]|uniref:Uncharacterized protein n=1 Tax=Achromobacter aegrifaciens TaxID=1287736 RepID=A0AAD2IZ04_ACHAE|nr:Uncharacterised protein [Achromobacter aegrifaciens]
MRVGVMIYAERPLAVNETSDLDFCKHHTPPPSPWQDADEFVGKPQKSEAFFSEYR